MPSREGEQCENQPKQHLSPDSSAYVDTAVALSGRKCHSSDDRNLDPNDKNWLVKALALQKEGVSLGIYGARIPESMSAFQACQETLIQQIQSPSHNFMKCQALHLMIRVCIHLAELHLVLFQYDPVKEACEQALEYHRELESISEAWRPKTGLREDDNNASRANNIEKNELDVLKADIYRCMSIVEYRLGDEQHKYWDLEGTSLLEHVVARDPTNEKAKSLLALFWSYQITTGDVDAENAVQDSVRAIDWLGALYERPASPDSVEDHEVHARRLSVVLRLASYAFRDVGMHEESMETIRGALEVIESLCRQRPRSVIYLFELYHCQCALAEHMELMAGTGGSIHDGGDDLFVLEARKDAVSALTRLTELLPQVPKYWRSLCTTLIDVADLQERNGAGYEALQASAKALQAATKCRACFPLYTITTTGNLNIVSQAEPKFEDQVEFARALLERGRHFYIQKMYEEALPFYEQALGVYTLYVLNHERAHREDEFYVELILRSMQAASSCATICHDLSASVDTTKDRNVSVDKAIWFLDQARSVSKERGGVKLRKNKVLTASLLLELAELHFTKHSNPVKAIEILQHDLLEELIIPMRHINPWHVTVGTVYGDAHLLLAKCYRAIGNAKHEIRHCEQYLRYAGERHGKDFSSWIGDETISASNQNDNEENGEEWEQAKLIRLREGCDTEVPAVKKYRLPVRNQMGQVSWYNLEVGSAIPNQDPLEDQARVWKEDYGVEIAEDIRESFRKLHDLALRNDVPMTDLCDYALSSSSSGSSHGPPSGSNTNYDARQQESNTANDNNHSSDNDGHNDEGTFSTSAETASLASEPEEDVDDNDHWHPIHSRSNSLSGGDEEEEDDRPVPDAVEIP